MIKNNKEKLLVISVMGEVVTAMFASTPPGNVGTPYLVSYRGEPTLVPMAGGIVYNVRLGDPVRGWEGDHFSPGVCIKNKDGNANNALNVYSCVGNIATVFSGDAKGAKGVVTGKLGHTGFVNVYFESEVLEKMAMGDRIQIKALGTGLMLEGFDDLKIWSLDPRLLEKMALSVGTDEKLRVPVKACVPADIIGAGSGNTGDRHDVEIMMSDEDVVKQNGLQDLRFGDIVAITDYDSACSNFFRSKAVTVGVVSHADSYMAGHGPGATVIMTSPTGQIEPAIDSKANIALLLGLSSSL